MLGCARYSIEIRLEISLAIGLSQVPHFPRLAKCLGMQLSRFDDEYAIATLNRYNAPSQKLKHNAMRYTKWEEN